MLDRLDRLYCRLSDGLGWITAILLVLMTLNVFLDVVLRYVFNTGSIALQEMEWHLFAVMFLLGISYGLKEDSHVRVDVIYDQLSPRKKAVINLVGTFFFLIPFSLLIAFGSMNFVAEAYESGEVSGDPGGLPYRWIIKAAIPFSFFVLALSSLGFIVQNLRRFRDNRDRNGEHEFLT
jgi:TRAP-type mannitol/chloroaromatic compound transport system permease small subunit